MEEEYNAQQLSEFLELAAKYLEDEGMEFVSDELHLDPNNPEDVAKFIAIAFAEHGDLPTKTNPRQVATNTPGDSKNSRGPWQIHVPSWKNLLEQYDIFDNYEDIKTALDKPELNAIAAVIIAQQGASEYRGEFFNGINNWETVMDTELDENDDKQLLEDDPYGIKKGGTPIYEGTSNFSPDVQTTPPLGQVEEETEYIEGEVDIKEYNFAPETTMDIDFMKKQLNLGKKGKLFNDDEHYYYIDTTQRLNENSGLNINNQIKNSLLNTDIENMQDVQVIEIYSQLVNPYVPLEVDMMNQGQGDGGAVIDNLHNRKFSNNHNYYNTKTKQVVKGSQLNKTEGFLSDSVYTQHTNRISKDNLKNLRNVYQYLLKTKQPFIKLSPHVELPESQPEPSPGSQMQGRKADAKPESRASDTFLNNWEKVLRVGNQAQPTNNGRLENRQRNLQRDFLRGR